MSLPKPALVRGRRRCFARLKAPYRLLLADLRIDHTVPTSFRCFDGASVPPLARPLLGVRPFDAEVVVASLVHDHLYQVPAARLDPGLDGWGDSRARADLLFWELLLRGGLSPRKAWIMYRAVDLGGAGAWQRPEDGPRACDPDAKKPCRRPGRTAGARRALVGLLEPPGALRDQLEQDHRALVAAGLGQHSPAPGLEAVAGLLRAAAELPDEAEGLA
jgi:Protein of unknown function (DUF1353)